MTYKITLFSQESEDFVLEIMIDADAYFMDLHKLILDSCHYSEGEGHCFLLCDENWHVSQRILLHDSGKLGSDEDLFLMEDSTLGDFIEDEGQRLAYVFDGVGRRLFLMELSEVIFGKPQLHPIVSRRHGQVPVQYWDEVVDEATVKPVPAVELEEEAESEESFDENEIDLEGFEIGEE